jgi:ACS family glucarate transporter-like MFS transporter
MICGAIAGGAPARRRDEPVSRFRYVPVRYRILGVLVALSFVNYLLRNNLSVAIPSIREEFGYSSAELGWILGSFNFAYALLQIPGGLFGQRYGPRRALAFITVSWGVLTFFTGLAPALMAASAAGAMVSLIVVRFLLGVANAPVYPVVAGAIANWFPPGRWAFPNAASSVGLALGQAALGPVVTLLIVEFGWRESFYLLAPLGLLGGAWWYWYARDTPAEHRAVTREELGVIAGDRDPGPGAGAARWRTVMLQRDVLLLSAAYFCMNYVFYMFSQWLFVYLVEERGFSLLESGLLYMLPFLTGAALAAVGGLTCDALCRRIGPRWGCRLPAMTGLVLVAAFLLAGAFSVNPYVAVAMLSLCFGFTQFTEGAFWSATTYSARPYTSAATGVLNTGGNLPGFLAPLIGLMVDQLGWISTLTSGSVFAVIGAVLWLFVQIEPRAPKLPSVAEPQPGQPARAGAQQPLPRPSPGATLQ